MGTTIPLLDLKAQYDSIRGEVRDVIEDVLESQTFILGPKVETLEKAIASYSGASYGIGVSSGTDALLVALMALDVGPGDEVITSPFTFFATAGVIARLRAVPVFADIDPETFNVDPKAIEQAVSKRTKAIIPVHLFGQCADMDPILSIAREKGIPVIEDAAQSIGAGYQGKRAGSMGTAGTFSFFPSKNLGCFGDGGMVVTDDAALAEKIRYLRHHGARIPYDHQTVGGNFRLDAIQAAVLGVKLRYLDGWSKARRANAEFYDSRLKAAGLVERGLIKIPAAAQRQHGETHYHTYNQYTLRTPRRDALRLYLKDAGIGSAVYYPIPLHLQACFRDLGYTAGSFPNSERAGKEVLSIPVYPELTLEQKERIVAAIVSFFDPRESP